MLSMVADLSDMQRDKRRQSIRKVGRLELNLIATGSFCRVGLEVCALGREVADLQFSSQTGPQ